MGRVPFGVWNGEGTLWSVEWGGYPVECGMGRVPLLYNVLYLIHSKY